MTNKYRRDNVIYHTLWHDSLSKPIIENDTECQIRRERLSSEYILEIIKYIVLKIYWKIKDLQVLTDIEG